MTRFFIFLLKIYRFIKAALGLPAVCRFYPSCSAYACQALAKYGLFKGIWLSLRRVIKCNPLSAGGYDPLE